MACDHRAGLRQASSSNRALRSGARPRGSSQRLRKVLDDVVRMLQPDGHAKQVLRRARLGAFYGMAMLDERFRSAETRCARDDREPVRKSDRRVTAAANLERQYRARARHLTASDLVSRVRREPGIVHSLDALVVREKLGDATRVASLRAYAPGQRSNTAQREPALEGR